MKLSAKTKRKVNFLKLLVLKYKYLNLSQVKSDEKRKKKKKRFWIRNFLADRKLHGAFHQLIPKLRSLNHNEELPETFLNYLRMTPECFDVLVEKVRPFIQRKLNGREPISVEEQLAVTLR